MQYLRFISSLLIIFLVVLNLLLFSSSVEGLSNNGVNPMHSLHDHHDKDGEVVVRYNRKLVAALDATLDYDYAGANPRHDPRGRRQGGGKNP